MTTDLKPRGVKRQWWLFPMDAWCQVTAKKQTIQVMPDTETGLRETLSATQMSGDPTMLGAFLVRRLANALECGEGRVLDLVCEVFEHGAKKYSPDNWRKAADAGLLEFRREYYSAICRHVFVDPKLSVGVLTLRNPTDLDDDSGLYHYAHGICGCLMWAWQELVRTQPMCKANGMMELDPINADWKAAYKQEIQRIFKMEIPLSFEDLFEDL